MSKLNWILEIVKGLLILIFGLFCLVNPASAAITLNWIIVIMILVFAVVAIADCLLLKESYKLWWIFIIECVTHATLAIILLLNPDNTSMIVTIIGIFAIITGVFRFLRIIPRRDMCLNNSIFGLGAIVAGVIFFLISNILVTSITIILGATAFVFGAIVIIFGIRMKLGKEK
jgi:uncharacterized membrane protein HdeD (DUF308 family)